MCGKFDVKLSPLSLSNVCITMRQHDVCVSVCLCVRVSHLTVTSRHMSQRRAVLRFCQWD